MIFFVFLAFVSLGLPDGVLGIAWPSFRDAYGLAQAELGVLLVGAGPGYFLSGLVAGRTMLRIGLGPTLVGSTFLVALGLSAFAAAMPWPLPVVALGVTGLGAGTIDAGINAYASARFSTRQVNWLHACYSLGAAIGPAVMTYAIASGHGWRAGYAVLAATLAVMTAVFAATGGRWTLATAESDAAAGTMPGAGLREALLHPLVPVQTALFFCFTGLEAGLGTWSYTVMTEERGLAAHLAGAWVSAYFGSILLGRIVLGAAVDRIGADRLVRVGTIGALGGVVLFAAGPAPLALAGLVTTGLALAPIFPTLISRSSTRLSPDVAVHAVGLKVSAAMLGSASVPIAAGIAAQWLGLWSVAPLCVVVALALLGLHESLLRRSAAAELRPALAAR